MSDYDSFAVFIFEDETAYQKSFGFTNREKVKERIVRDEEVLLRIGRR